MNRIAVFFFFFGFTSAKWTFAQETLQRSTLLIHPYISSGDSLVLSFWWDLEGKSKQIFYATSASATTSSSRLLAKVGEETEHFD